MEDAGPRQHWLLSPSQVREGYLLKRFAIESAALLPKLFERKAGVKVLLRVRHNKKSNERQGFWLYRSR